MSNGAMQVALKRQRDNRSQGEAVAGQEHWCGGHIEMGGVGFARASVQFPIRFSIKPVVTFGYEVAPGTKTDRDAFPSLEALVREWQVVRRGDRDNLTYLGATFLMRSTGLDGAVMVLHWQAVGPAIIDPVSSLDEPVEGAI